MHYFRKYIFLLLAGWSAYAFSDHSIDKPYYIFNGVNNNNADLFETFNSVLHHLDLYDLGKIAGLEMSFKKDGKYYDEERTDNWWEYYFSPLKIANQNLVIKERVPFYKIYKTGFKANFEMTSSRAYELIHKYIQIKPAILDEVTKFVTKQFSDYVVIGIDYEKPTYNDFMPYIPYEKMEENLLKLIGGLAYLDILKETPDEVSSEFHYKIFLSSTDQKFLDFMKERFQEKVICYQQSEYHQNQYDFSFEESKYTKPSNEGKELLVNALILSKANVVLQTGSSMSKLVKKLNPSLLAIELDENWLEKK